MGAALKAQAREQKRQEDAAKRGADFNHQLDPGSLSAAPPAMLNDFNNDMQQLAQASGIEIIVEAEYDRLNVRGNAQRCLEMQDQFQAVLAYYFAGDEAIDVDG